MLIRPHGLRRAQREWDKNGAQIVRIGGWAAPEMRPVESNDKVERLKDISACPACEGQVRT